MNRRTFIKYTGATALAIVPLKVSDITANEAQICNSKFLSCKSKWISFTEKMPEVGRDIISLCYFNDKASMNISIGKVHNPKVIGFPGWDPYPEMCIIELEIDYSEYYNNKGLIDKTEIKMWKSDVPPHVAMERLQQTYNFGWECKYHHSTGINRSFITYKSGTCWSPRHGLKKAPYIGRDATYWMYYDGLMEELPTLPEWKPPVIEYRHTLTGGSVGHGILIKE